MGKRHFKAAALIGRSSVSQTLEVTSPCGICRQMLFEDSQMSGIDMELILSNTDQSRIILTAISELLPLAFGPMHIKVF
jgi:cytidine deaminase